MSTHTQLVALGAIGGLGVVALIAGFLPPRRPGIMETSAAPAREHSDHVAAGNHTGRNTVKAGASP